MPERAPGANSAAPAQSRRIVGRPQPAAIQEFNERQRAPAGTPLDNPASTHEPQAAPAPPSALPRDPVSESDGLVFSARMQAAITTASQQAEASKLGLEEQKQLTRNN